MREWKERDGESREELELKANGDPFRDEVAQLLMPKGSSCRHQIEYQGSWSIEKPPCAAGQTQREGDNGASAPYI